MIKFSETGRKLRDGVIPAGTTVWKKVAIRPLTDNWTRLPAIAQLITLEDGIIPIECRRQIQAKTAQLSYIDYCGDRVTAYRKCRIPAAYVVSIVRMDTGESVCSAESYHTSGFKYAVGEVVKEPSFDKHPDSVCTDGIHVFLTKKEAELYSDF